MCVIQNGVTPENQLSKCVELCAEDILVETRTRENLGEDLNLRIGQWHCLPACLNVLPETVDQFITARNNILETFNKEQPSFWKWKIKDPKQVVRQFCLDKSLQYLTPQQAQDSIRSGVDPMSYLPEECKRINSEKASSSE